MQLSLELSDCTIFLLAKAYQKAHSDFKKRLKPYGITNMQHLVLESLRYEEGITATELGKALILDKATLSGVIDRLWESGWVKKEKDLHDNRIYRLYLTPKAKDITEQLLRERKKFDNALLRKFSREESVLLKRLLKDLI